MRPVAGIAGLAAVVVVVAEGKGCELERACVGNPLESCQLVFYAESTRFYLPPHCRPGLAVFALAASNFHQLRQNCFGSLKWATFATIGPGSKRRAAGDAGRTGCSSRSRQRSSGHL